MNPKQIEVLEFIYNRLIKVHGENPNYDYMMNLNIIIRSAEIRLKLEKDILEKDWAGGVNNE